MSKRPYFSIITVCYNSEKTIHNTFDSLLRQTYKNFEYIVVDGASRDLTLDIIQKYSKLFKKRQITFRWISEKDSGIYNAMNKGIHMAKGCIIGIINSDDTYTEHALQDIYEASISNPDYDIYHGLMRFWSEGALTMIRGLGDNYLSTGMMEHPACFVRYDLYKKIGGFNERYQYVADYEFMLRVKNRNGRFFLVESILSNFDENGAGNSFASRKELIILRREYHLSNNLTLFLQFIKILIREIKERI